ncbi:MAG: hypothetical protein HQM00_07795 [Magnetococcales bacterium]|nr:hypothetical protein [Magnetococcales bacterium]
MGSNSSSTGQSSNTEPCFVQEKNMNYYFDDSIKDIESQLSCARQGSVFLVFVAILLLGATGYFCFHSYNETQKMFSEKSPPSGGKEDVTGKKISSNCNGVVNNIVNGKIESNDCKDSFRDVNSYRSTLSISVFVLVAIVQVTIVFVFAWLLRSRMEHTKNLQFEIASLATNKAILLSAVCLHKEDSIKNAVSVTFKDGAKFVFDSKCENISTLEKKHLENRVRDLDTMNARLLGKITAPNRISADVTIK